MIRDWKRKTGGCFHSEEKALRQPVLLQRNLNELFKRYIIKKIVILKNVVLFFLKKVIIILINN